jgi:hypothetical protein
MSITDSLPLPATCLTVHHQLNLGINQMPELQHVERDDGEAERNRGEHSCCGNDLPHTRSEQKAMQYAGPASEEREAIQVPELDWPADLFVDPSWQTKDQRVSPAEYSELPNSCWLIMKDRWR